MFLCLYFASVLYSRPSKFVFCVFFVFLCFIDCYLVFRPQGCNKLDLTFPLDRSFRSTVSEWRGYGVGSGDVYTPTRIGIWVHLYILLHFYQPNTTFSVPVIVSWYVLADIFSGKCFRPHSAYDLSPLPNLQPPL